jgi:putative spermidine/putrescine transport system ATP-binding protein
VTRLVLEGIGKRFGEITALADIDLAIPDGSFVCFLGPSGCGKTTLLRIVAGLEEPSAGRVLIGDEDVTAVPTSRRGVGMVFQSLALFPHLDVGENIAYSLRIRGVP